MSLAAPAGAGLLDVNVLVALAWPNHVHHEQAREWFARSHRDGWATTPVTEIGFVRVSSNRAAISAASTPDASTRLLRALTGLGGHEFWTDDVALVTGGQLDVEATISHRDVTDLHLIALARRYGGRLVSFDAKIARLLADDDHPLLELLPDAAGGG